MSAEAGSRPRPRADAPGPGELGGAASTELARWRSPLGRDTSHGFLAAREHPERVFIPQLIANRGETTMLSAIRAELRRAQSFTFSVAFITQGALALLKQALLDFSGAGRIITSTYLAFNEPEMFRELLRLPGVTTLLHPGAPGGFHAKGYVFEAQDTVTAMVGSSNLTTNALLRNSEWNLRFTTARGGDLATQLSRELTDQLARSTPLTEDWIASYEATRPAAPPPARALTDLEEGMSALAEDADGVPAAPILPNSMQRAALAQLGETLARGARRALIISATGTGKTILSALAARELEPRRLLFVVHREEILDRAVRE